MGNVVNKIPNPCIIACYSICVWLFLYETPNTASTICQLCCRNNPGHDWRLCSNWIYRFLTSDSQRDTWPSSRWGDCHTPLTELSGWDSLQPTMTVNMKRHSSWSALRDGYWWGMNLLIYEDLGPALGVVLAAPSFRGFVRGAAVLLPPRLEGSSENPVDEENICFDWLAWSSQVKHRHLL